MDTHTEPAQHVELTGTDSVSDGAPADEERGGPGQLGLMLLRFDFWSTAYLSLLSRTRVDLDGQRYEFSWGQLRVPVAAGRHQLQVSFRYLGNDRGAATKDFDVREGHIVELTYKAPWLVFLPGKLRMRGQDRPLPVQEMPRDLAGSALPPAATPGWHRDPSGGHQRRWWDGERWTPTIFRPHSRAWKASVAMLAVITLVVASIVGGAIGSAIRGGTDGSAALAESGEWITVTEMDGVRFDMPRQPQHSSEPIPGTDLTADMHYLDLGDIGMVAGGVTTIPGDTRTDAAILRDSVNGSAANIDGTIAFSRQTVVDGEPGLDFEVTTPTNGGATVLGTVALADDLLVIIETVFLDEDDRDVAAVAHNRMSSSIRFEG